MVLKNVGPKGYPGMAEVGNMALPKKLLEQGITDMVRISDGRMSGTGFGTVVLHVSPEAAVGGTLAFVQNGDIISLDAHNRTIQLEVSEEELSARKAAWEPTEIDPSARICSFVSNTCRAGASGRRHGFFKRWFGE